MMNAFDHSYFPKCPVLLNWTNHRIISHGKMSR